MAFPEEPLEQTMDYFSIETFADIKKLMKNKLILNQKCETTVSMTRNIMMKTKKGFTGMIKV